MHDINGYVYGNLPGLSMCRGERVAWHIMSGILMHSATFYGNTILFEGKRTDSVGLIQGEPEQGPVSRKSRELFGPEKLIVKSRPAYSVKLIFSHVVKGIKIKIMAKFRASRRLRFEDTKRIISPEIRPKSFGTFEKQAPEAQNSNSCYYS